MNDNSNPGTLCYRISEFCRYARICRTKLYALLKAGQGPKTIKIGRIRLILADTGRQWLRKLELATEIRAAGPVEPQGQRALKGDRP